VTSATTIEELASLSEDFKGYLDTLSEAELREMILLTDSLATAFDTKFHVYESAPIAHKFHESSAKIRAAFGGNRSSKTYSHIIDYGAQFCGEAPPSLEGIIPKHRLDPTRQNRLCMNDYPNSFMKVIWPYIRQLIPADKVAGVEKDSGRIKAIHNYQGGLLEFMQYDQDVEKFQGTSRHSIGYDEEPPEDIRDENLARLIDTDGEETFSLTPISGALKYLYDKVFLKRSREVENDYDFILDNKGRLIDAIFSHHRDVEILGDEADPDIHCFFYNIFDNPAISKEAAIRKLSKFPKEETIVRGKGHFLFISGMVYPGFSDHLHVIPDFNDWYSGDTQQFYTLYVAIDPHPRVPHAVLFLVVSADGTKYLVDDLYTDCNAEALVDAIRIKCRGRIPELILIDPMAYTPDPSTKSCLATDLIDFGMNDPFPIAASKDKARGILRCQQLLAPAETSGKPGVYVTDNCSNFRREITRYSWDDWRKHERNTKGPKLEAVKKDDHFMENFYRLVLADPQYIDPITYDDILDEMRAEQAVGRSAVTGY